jgi:hypothetical protein
VADRQAARLSAKYGEPIAVPTNNNPASGVSLK